MGNSENGTNALKAAAKKVAETRRIEEEEATRRNEERNRKEDFLRQAERDLKAIQDRLFAKIQTVAESANVEIRNHQLTLGDGAITVTRPLQFIPNLECTLNDGEVLPATKMYEKLGFEAIAGSAIGVVCTSEGYRHSATLLYLKKDGEEEFRWYQIAFKFSAISNRRDPNRSFFALQPNDVDIYIAISPTMHIVEVVYGPEPIDGDAYQGFEDHWCKLLAQAATGELFTNRG